MRPVQYFSVDYLEHCKSLSPEEIVKFLEDFRLLHGSRSPIRLISLKIPETLLAAFRHRCRMEDVAYQTQIKKLMRDWLGVSEEL
jgi:hypothetical protein